MAKNSLSKYTDEELWIRYRQTEELGCLGELYQRYIPLVYGLSLKYLQDREDAQDAVMDIYEMVVQKAIMYDIKNFKSWLYTVSKNHCLSSLKQKQGKIHLRIEDSFMENEENFTLLDNMQSEEEIKALEYCMQQLSDEQRISIRFFYIESFSYADIVEKTGFALSKVKSYIQNGKRNLKNCIIDLLKV